MTVKTIHAATIAPRIQRTLIAPTTQAMATTSIAQVATTAPPQTSVAEQVPMQGATQASRPIAHVIMHQTQTKSFPIHNHAEGPSKIMVGKRKDATVETPEDDTSEDEESMDTVEMQLELMKREAQELEKLKAQLASEKTVLENSVTLKNSCGKKFESRRTEKIDKRPSLGEMTAGKAEA